MSGPVLLILLLALPASDAAAEVKCFKDAHDHYWGCPDGEKCAPATQKGLNGCRCRAKNGSLSVCGPIDAPNLSGGSQKLPPGFEKLLTQPGPRPGGLPPIPGVFPGDFPDELPGQPVEPPPDFGRINKAEDRERGNRANDPVRINKANDRVQAGRKAYDREDYTAAIENLKAAASLNPDLKAGIRDLLAGSYFQRGAKYLDAQEYEDAIREFKQALEIKPDFENAEMALAFAQKKQKEPPTVQMDVTAGKPAPSVKPAAQQVKTPFLDAYPMASGERPAEPRSSSNKFGLVLMLSGAAVVVGIVGILVAVRMRRESPAAGEEYQGASAEGPVRAEGPGAAADPGQRVREFMQAGLYDKALAALAAKDPAKLTEADRVALFEIHLRLGNVDGARMVYESVKGGGLLAGDAALRETLAGLCSKVGLGGPAGELTNRKISRVRTVSAPSASVLAEGLDNSPPYAQTVTLAKEGKYDEALAAVLKKSKDRLTLNDHNLLFEIYMRRRDHDRAELMLRQVEQGIAAAQPVKRVEGRLFYAYNPAAPYPRVYLFFAAMARFCREKGRPDFASRFCRLTVDCVVTSLPVRERAQEIYELALSFEADGERECALDLYRALAANGPAYKDSAARMQKLEAPAAAAPAPKVGTASAGIVIGGRYELRGELGSGGMGVVFEGSDRRDNTPVAVKRMHSALKEFPQEYQRFVGEAKIVERLKHPNIVGVRSIVEQGGETYLVFDYVDGRTLGQILKEKQRLPLDECTAIFKGVCEAVHYAHKNNIIHRDIKPANIMVTGNNTVKVMDFGLASELRESMTRLTHQTTSGTPAYMAPEQYAGLVKRESDIYAMGVCLYEMLTGKLPFEGREYESLKAAKCYREISAVLPWLPGGVDAVVARALDPEPSQRYADALDFYEALKNL